jgi:hypothetical protein
MDLPADNRAAADPVAVVRTMSEAYRDGRMEDMLATLDSSVVWTPITRPGLSRYFGHPGVQQLHAAATAIYGSYRSEADTYTLQDDGSVVVRGRVVGLSAAEPNVLMYYEAVCVVRDGLIVSIDSSEVGFD